VHVVMEVVRLVLARGLNAKLVQSAEDLGFNESNYF
jgi:hypothetical protein